MEALIKIHNDSLLAVLISHENDLMEFYDVYSHIHCF